MRGRVGALPEGAQLAVNVRELAGDSVASCGDAGGGDVELGKLAADQNRNQTVAARREGAAPCGAGFVGQGVALFLPLGAVVTSQAAA